MLPRLCGLLLLVFFALMGCETEPWVKPGATTAQLRRDLADCERVATGTTPFHFWALDLSYERARDRMVERKAECMKGRGWTPAVARRDLPFVPPCGEAAGVPCDGQAGGTKTAL
jgi:hypothetical protein